ncbi:hypothetical protein KO528_18430 [Saccharophagus degradans]|uniref:hypothetical protein n=1 Tax=Saccharophagus degradans TaxID=86304 RepID=UPI001C08104C|nr:hypothetical protein [Saccharophagus degradans]MBU2987347.1 hypothetical protein [Saccharophagus degradans]
MKLELVNEIIECLGGERRLFCFYPGCHWVNTLVNAMQQRALSTVKCGELNTLCGTNVRDKPVIKNALKYFADGKLSITDLACLTPAETQMFNLSLAAWGDGARGWDQTSRNQSNLVLQVNFATSHVKKYEALVKPDDLEHGPFESWCHPVHQEGRKTMAWARMDIDFATNTVLIEEIQNDWLRKAQQAWRKIEKRRQKNPTLKPATVNSEIGASYEAFSKYINQELAVYEKHWAEATMAATIHFIRSELGISNIYYHTFETGIKLKQVSGKPPLSLYTKLPKSFGFKVTQKAPEFLLRDKVSRRYLKAIGRAEWFYLGE